MVLAFLELFAVCVNSRDPPDQSSLLAAVKWGQCVGLVSDTNLSLSNLKKYLYPARLYILLVLPNPRALPGLHMAKLMSCLVRA